MGKLKNIAVVLFMIVFLASLFMNVVHFASRQQKTRDTTRTTYVDTIPFYKPIPKDSFVIRYVTERLPTVSKLPENVQKLPESVSEFPKIVKNFHESVSEDSVDAVSYTHLVVFCGLATARVRTAVSLLRSRTVHLRARSRTTGRGWPSAENS